MQGELEMPSIWTMFSICRNVVKLVNKEEDNYKLVCECGHEFKNLFQTHKTCPKCGAFNKTRKVAR